MRTFTVAISAARRRSAPCDAAAHWALSQHGRSIITIPSPAGSPSFGAALLQLLCLLLLLPLALLLLLLLLLRRCCQGPGAEAQSRGRGELPSSAGRA